MGVVLLAVLAMVAGEASLVPLAAGPWAGRRVLLVGAHPDDIEGFGGGWWGLLLLLILLLILFIFLFFFCFLSLFFFRFFFIIITGGD